ncbi:ornithine cyclodeaminase/mu-crystallin [Kipferlia bialata]|uniref:Ornithine cyclodeaminase/mu-crystallin n=1 Tax=Kipferlia bialata TaxID=797122 RepID=A0A9K3CNC5_9EUKA|nr:ornithine cyclodeaminase/mu-crystallin [Kipferlia bialata]|eukprot:g1070.t1
MPMALAVSATERAFKALSTEGICTIPPRIHMPGGGDGDMGLFMPGIVHTETETAMGLKVINIRPDNPQRHMPTLPSLYTDFDPVTGMPLACLDGGALTYLRTGAANGVAARYLSREDSSTLAVLGVGAQGKAGTEAILCVRPITEVCAYDCMPGAAEAYIEWLKEKAPRVKGTVMTDPDEAVSQADIVLTCTPSTSPLFSPSSVRPGTHISAVGAYTPEMVEIPPETIAGAYVVVDSLPACIEEAGGIIQAVQAGLMSWSDVQGEVGSLAKGEIKGRTSPSQVTMFKTVGSAVQDVVVGHEICQLAQQKDMGTKTPDLWNH